MRLQSLFLSAACALVFLTGCEQETVAKEAAAADLTAQLDLNAKQQKPSVAFDTSKKGIYHGVVAHESNQSRGKIWINLGNNTKYDATIEMVGDQKMYFKSSSNYNKEQEYNYTGKSGSFTITMNDLNNPEITSMALNNESYFGYVIKSTNANRATSYTGTFNQTGGGFSGTWNILSNGAFNPNAFSGTAISDVMVTLNGTMYTDSTIEIGSFSALGFASWIPIVDILSTSNEGIVAFSQQTTIASGVTSWNLWYNTSALGDTGYYSEGGALINSGTFSWNNPTTGNTIYGEIYIDISL